MDLVTTTRAEAEATRPPKTLPTTPYSRIVFVTPAALGPLSLWETALDRYASLGFSRVLAAPVFDPVSGDLDRPAPALGWDGDTGSALRRIAELCRARDMDLLIDLAPDRLPAASPSVSAQPFLFRLPDPGRQLDPRSYDPAGAVARARWNEHPDRLAEMWAARCGTWLAAGVAGFRLPTLADMPADAVRRLIARVASHHAATWLGWTPGMTQVQIAALRGVGLDFVVSSLPWWDFRAEWFWTELELLRSIAPVLAAVEAPYGPRAMRAIREPGLRRVALQRLLDSAVALGDGWMMPAGFEVGATRPLDAHPVGPGPLDLSAEIRHANERAAPLGPVRLLSAPGAGVLAFLRAGPDPRRPAPRLTVLNSDLGSAHRVVPATLLAGAGVLADGADAALALAPGEVRSQDLRPAPPITQARPPLLQTAAEAGSAPRLGIENVSPSVEHGRFPAKRTAGESVTVEADILCDGHDQLAAVVLWRTAAETEWHEVRMRPLGNDRWQARFPLLQVGRHEFTIQAWRDAFATFRDELTKKHTAGVDVHLELIEGVHLVDHAALAATGTLHGALAELAAAVQSADAQAQIGMLLRADTAALMARADPRPFAVQPDHPFPIDADRVAASFASWYEIFPRSMSDDAQRHGTFLDVIRHLPRIRDIGSDVLYFPPIHPIGRTNRKGRNNTLTPAADDPGSPYAIGSPEGGHDAIHKQLGSLDDFLALRDAAAEHGMELALDFAIQCSPDHPWLKEHPDWFAWRPDGSIRFAENPPKKYEDIVNVDFYAGAAVPDLWVALAEVVMFWAGNGVRIFRVDNPHTKPFPFWEWMIAEVRARYPDTIFLAEAFTRPKIMGRLGRIGFSQSYTYFTWRNSRRELEEYVTELAGPDWSDCYRPNFFVNTPDINPVFLQTSGRPGFLIRAALAATLSGSWGVYCGFELCEGTPIPGREEYLDSEKYQIRAWDWDRPGNIVPEITQLNRLRRHNPALQTNLGVTFIPTANDQMLVFEKATPDRGNVVFVAVSLDPLNPQTADIAWPFWKWDLPDTGRVATEDLLHGGAAVWQGRWQRLSLDPRAPYAIWRAGPAG